MHVQSVYVCIAIQLLQIHSWWLFSNFTLGYSWKHSYILQLASLCQLDTQVAICIVQLATHTFELPLWAPSLVMLKTTVIKNKTYIQYACYILAQYCWQQNMLQWTTREFPWKSPIIMSPLLHMTISVAMIQFRYNKCMIL